MKILSNKRLIFLCLIIISSLVSAQGVLRGVIKDSITNEKLIGAHIALMNSSLGGTSNIEGEYRVSNIPAGTYMVTISYVGYEPLVQTIEIADKQTTKFNFKLIPSAIMGKEVVVKGQALGQVAAINQQLSSNTIVNVVSEEKIKELPDANAAESIGRLPGVALQRSGGEANKVVMRGMSDKFSTITVDGVRLAPTDADSRGVDLSTVSQGSLAGIELFKALTPDKDGDAIAGSVNLVTKKAPTERTITLDAKGSYNKMEESARQYDFQLKYGERFFNDLLGVQLTGNTERRIRSKEDVDISYNLFDKLGVDGKSKLKDYKINDFNVNYTDELRKRNGFSLLLDINTPDDGSIRFNNIFNSTKRDYILFSRNYPTDQTDVNYSARDREQEIQTYNSSVRGENHLFGFDINWNMSYAKSKGDFPYDYEMTFLEPSITDNGQIISGMKNVPDMKSSPENIIPFALNNFGKSYLYTAYDRGQKNEDVEKTATIDIARKYNLVSNIGGELKFGGKYRVKSRYRESYELLSTYYNDEFRKYYRDSDGNIKLKDFTGTRFADLYNSGMINGRVLYTNFLDMIPSSRNVYDKYLLNPILNRDALRLWRSMNINGVASLQGGSREYSRNLEYDAQYYDVTERVSAAYVMNTLNIGQDLTLIAGLRLENENNDYKSKYSPGILDGVPTPQGILKDTTAHHNELVWLPNFHVAYKATDFMNIRLAAYKALARPDFNERLENYIARRSSFFYSGNSITIGNPGLKAAKAWNFECNTSFFGNTIGLFTVSAFYKDISDMYHTINGIQMSDSKFLDSMGVKWKVPKTFSNYGLLYQYNSKKATKVWGFEIEHQANLKFLPGYLQYLVLNYNFSIVRSETYVPTSRTDTTYTIDPDWGFPIPSFKQVMYETKQKLEGQPEFFCNFSLGYEMPEWGFSARVSIFYQGEYDKSYSKDSRTDLIVNDYTRVDLAIKQEITKNISVMLNLNNLTNTEEGVSYKNRVEGWTISKSSEKYGVTGDLGIRVNL